MAPVKISMDTFVKRFQPERYQLWREGKDTGPHPEDMPEEVASTQRQYNEIHDREETSPNLTENLISTTATTEGHVHETFDQRQNAEVNPEPTVKPLATPGKETQRARPIVDSATPAKILAVDVAGNFILHLFKIKK